ncbi:hypothetical protein AAVH_31029 [Aphelenchoides avenae]|nr:hypothetical protein AAVH_31029 [Aphelenchus avenae]
MFCASIFKKALSEPAKNDLLLVMRVRNLEQDLSGILGWRITKNKNFDNNEVYTAEDSRGQRICLTINRLDSLTMKEWGWRSSTIDFRRSKQCRCKSACAPQDYVSNDGNFNKDYDDIHAGGFGANHGFDDDGW